MQFDINNIIRENIKGLQPYSSARDEYVSDGSRMVFLDANENPYETGVNRYPDPQQRNLKTVLADQKQIGIDQILLGNGSDEVLDLIFRAFCEPKEDNVITLPPTYGIYKVLANTNAVEDRQVLLSNDFEPDVNAIFEKVDGNTKIIFLCSPNNPTGNSFSKEKIDQILTNFSGLVVLDEAYIDFSDQQSWINALDTYPNLVIIQTLSKAYGLAGIRLGICYASKEIISVLNKIKPPYNVNELTQKKALLRVSDPQVITNEVEAIVQQRELLIKNLAEIPFIERIYPSDANFILVKVDDAQKRYDQLLQKRIVIRNRSTQPLCENTLRLTVGTREENIVLVKAIKSIA